MEINWGLAGQNGFGNALAFGMQMGQQMRERRDQKEYAGALQQIFAPKQTPGTPGIGDGMTAPDLSQAEAVIAERNPQLYVQLQQQRQAEQRQGQVRELYAKATGGDAGAMDQLFMADPDLWKRLDDRTREQVKTSTSFMAQSAFQIGRLPENQRAAAWAQAVQSAEANGMDIPPHLEVYSPAALNYTIASAEKTEAYIKQFEPDWRAVPQGGYLENVNPLSNPQGSTAPQGRAVARTGTAPDGRRVIQYNDGSIEYDGGQTATPSATFSAGFRGLDGEQVTSTYRTPAHNRKVGGVANSYHTRRDANGNPMARDSVPPPGMSMSAYAERLRRLNPHLDVINEGDHVHMEPKG